MFNHTGDKRMATQDECTYFVTDVIRDGSEDDGTALMDVWEGPMSLEEAQARAGEIEPGFPDVKIEAVEDLDKAGEYWARFNRDRAAGV